MKLKGKPLEISGLVCIFAVHSHFIRMIVCMLSEIIFIKETREQLFLKQLSVSKVYGLWLENWNEKGLGLNLWWRYSELTEKEKE